MTPTDVRVATIPSTASTADNGQETRPVVRCARCRLVQFRASHNRCRRCYFPFAVEVPPPPPPAPANGQHPDVAAGVRCWRRVRGLTQKELASAAQLPRTYISRIENGRILPGLPTLERVAEALHVGLATLLEVLRNGNGNGNGQGGPISAHGNGNGNGHDNGDGDEFLRQMLRYSAQLSPAQRATVLTKVRQLATVRN